MEEECGDQIWVAADDAELAAELFFPVGHGAGTPSPLPVREAAVETVPNHEDMDCSEHQIRLSKGVTAKFVQPLKLGSAIQAGAPAARAAGFAPLSLTVGFVADPETQNKTKKATETVPFPQVAFAGLER